MASNESSSIQRPWIKPIIEPILLASGTIGIFGNIVIIAAVFRKGSALKNKCSALIGLLAVSDAVSATEFVIAEIWRLTGWENVPQWDCFLIHIPFYFGFICSAYLVLAIGIDRYISMRYATKYFVMKKRHYVFCHSLVGLALSFSVVFTGLLTGRKDSVVVECNTMSGLSDEARSVYMTIVMFLALNTGIAYFLAIRYLKKATFESQWIAKREKHLMSSLVVIVCIHFVTLFAPILFGLLASVFKYKELSFVAGFVAGFLVSMNYNVNFFIYLARSVEYRKEFRKVLCFFCLKQNTAAVTFYVTPP